MAKEFFLRLQNYYLSVAKVLRGEAEASSIFPNTTDIGFSREKIYVEFLKQHAPSKCNIHLGGFLFDEDGYESKQLDIIVTTDTSPCFNFNNKDGAGKSFSPVEGTLGVVSVKSTLNKLELYNALDNIASIPPTRPLEGRVNILFQIKHYDDWPIKIIYASNGIAPETLLEHLTQYYQDHPDIPINRRPNYIHVAGMCFIVRVQEHMYIYDNNNKTKMRPDIGAFILITNQITFKYHSLIDKIMGIPN